MTKEQFSNYINNFDFSELFRRNGWDDFTADHKIEVQNTIYTLTGLVHKKNFPILQVISEKVTIPDLNTRKQLERKIRSLYFDHLLVITDKERTWQYWQLPLHEDGKIQKLVTFSWRKGQDAEALFQKFRNIVFELKEEDILTLSDVKERVNTISANSEKVTKKFYNEFITQHKTFLGFIKGIEDVIPDTENNKKQWYASLMLNRLMFCYFIQKKGFLDNNPDYLPEKLKECKKHSGKNNFYGFYRSFLLELFHNELGRPEDKRKKNASPVPFGVIPYLNGGLFDIHELESVYTKIAIKDEAFERIFTFFDEWHWHLDTRITASGKDINPDVIGYIFEKYINQKEMGAYYTKEDITDYIGKNTIIPFLLDKVKSRHSAPFESGGGFWQYLQDSGDEYIYDSVKKGGEGSTSLDDVNIPENIRIGIDTQKPNLLERRKDWNTVTSDNDIGLPTEIWRETVSRLQRYFELQEKITKGKIQEINDLITYNLNIRKLIQDYLEQTQDPKFIREFYKALTEITILDPTCGSGAFLFAALNILEPLYEVCILRMEECWKANPKGNKDFEDRLTTLHSSEHPNLSYYIFKTIILNNLYGVDLMKEAVEIAKLRLFLKLVAEVDPSKRKKNYGLEPLPDIDFNIRSGNTLVGFATEQQLEEVVKNTEGELIYKEKLDELKSKCKSVEKIFNHFQEIQIEVGSNNEKYKEIKKSLTVDLKELDEKLNRYLARAYGINIDAKMHKDGKKEYENWIKCHQPFHWFAEFYGIISKGGFDVIIGNPPYVAFHKIDYKINFSDFHSSDIFSFVIKRSFELINIKSRYGFIVMHNIAFSRNFNDTRKIIRENAKAVWFSFFARIPAGLFSGDVRVRNCIFLLENGKVQEKHSLYTTRIHRWFSESREYLFNIINYTSFLFQDTIPMFNSPILADLFQDMKGKSLTQFEVKGTKHILYYKQSAYNWITVSKSPAPCYGSKGKLIPQTKVGNFSLSNTDFLLYSFLLLNGKLFFSYWLTYGDEFDVTKEVLLSIKVPYESLKEEDKIVLQELGKEFSDAIKDTIQYKLNAGKKVGTFNTSKLWHITDKSDKIFLKYLTDKPVETFEAIQDHITATVITDKGELEGEE
jgi:hypothetical protein